MRISSFGYLTRQGMKNLWRNRMMTLASVSVLTACLLIVGIAMLLTANLNRVVEYVESENEFKAFVVKEDDYLIQQLENGLLVLDESALPEESAAEEPTESVTEEETASAAEKSDKDKKDTEKTKEKTTSETTSETEEEAAGSEPAKEGSTVTVDELALAKEQFDWDGFCANLQSQIQSIPNVEDVSFVSKDEGIESMKDQLGDQAELLDDYEGEENPLNDSFTIRVKDLTQLSDTIEQVSGLEGIQTVSAANSVAKTLTQIRRIVNVAGWSLVAALAIVSLVIITNTIRASIFSRRKELNIMSYVGATKSFIRLPFVVEGICLGLISAVVAYGLITLGYTAVMNKLLEQQTGWLGSAIQSLIPYSQIALDMGIFFLISSVLIGVIGSTISIRSHIKV
jgi:cell division transport system permease protein